MNLFYYNVLKELNRQGKHAQVIRYYKENKDNFNVNESNKSNLHVFATKAYQQYLFAEQEILKNPNIPESSSAVFLNTTTSQRYHQKE